MPDFGYEDFNADNISDLAFVSKDSSELSLLIGREDGTLNEPIGKTKVEALPTTLETLSTQAENVNTKIDEDFNRDDIVDSVFINSATNVVVVELGQEDGSNAEAIEYTVGDNPSAIAFADFDNDGATDLAVTNKDSNSVSVLWGYGDGTFEEKVDYAVGNAPVDLSAEDYNQDGYVDLLALNQNDNDFTLLIGDRQGTFKEISELSDNDVSLPANRGSQSVELEDINNDGILDLISSGGYYYSNNVSVFLGIGDGNFEPRQDYRVGYGSSSFSLGDANNDGILDLVVANNNYYGSVSLLLGIGDGTFNQSQNYYLGRRSYPNTVLLEDFNSDGIVDLVAKGRYGLSVFAGDGVGGFGEQTNYNISLGYGSFIIEDTNGDNIQDIISTKYSNDGAILIQLGTGDGSFAEPVEYSVGRYPAEFIYDDANNDGLDDIVVSSSNSISILSGQEDGTFVDNNEFAVSGNLRHLQVGDINLDGITDIAALDLGDDSVSVFLGEEEGSFAQALKFDAGTNSRDLALGDLDGDGDLDLANANYGSYYNNGEINLNFNNIYGGFATVEGERVTEYDPVFNQITEDTDELGRTTLYDIDPDNGNLLGTTQVVGRIGGLDDVTTNYDYTDTGLLDTQTDPLGRTTDNDYDEYGRLIKTTYAKGTEDEASVNYEYDASGNQTAMVDENGNRSEFEYDGLNRLVKSIYAIGTPDEATETTEYDASGNIIASVDANGNRTEYEYDAMNRLIKTISPDPDGDEKLTSPETESEYDASGNLISSIDALGRETKYVYDDRDRLVETIRPDGTVNKSEYDADNNVVGSEDAGGNESSQVYDARGRLIQETDAQGNPIRYEYDAAGQLIASVDGNGNRTEYEYDELGRQVAVTDGEGNVTRTEYDKAGNVVATVDGLGNRTEYGFDERDRNITVTDAEGGTTTTEYDDVGNVISITDPVNNQTSYTYDAQNRVEVETNELGFTRTFEYDDVGNSISTTDRNGRTREFAYDGLNRQIEENWLDDAGNSIRTSDSKYDAANQLIATDDPDSAYNFTYDELGRLVTVDNAGTPSVPNVVLTYNYDESGNIISVSDTIDGEPGATTAYNYDELDRVDRITQFGNNVAEKRVDFDFDAIGQYESITRYSDLSGTELVAESSYTYDDANRLTDLTHSNSTTEIANYDLTYDAASRITQIVDADGTNDYSYDKSDQLTTAVHSDENNPDETYSYDKNGNRVSSSLHEDGYVTDANNRLASDGTYNYRYDKQGNLIRQTEIATGNVQELEWDYLNRLVAVTDKDSSGNETQTVEFAYDMFGKRLSKIVDGEATYFVYDRDNVILDFVDADGIEGEAEAELDKRYLHGERVDQVLAQEDASGDVTWHLSDHLGSVRDLVDNNGNAVNHFVYDSFGNVIAETDDTVDTRYLYTGREWDDEIGLQYNRARYYDPESGIFINEDPIGFNAEDTNLYRYANNTPIISIDPSGLVTFAVPGADGLDRLPVNIFTLPGRRYGVFPLPSNPISAISLAVGLVRFRQPGEPVNVIAHSNGNLNIVPLLVPALRQALRGDNCEPNVRINVARLDPTFVPKATVIGANRIVDVGSNNPNSDDIRDWASLRFLRPDFRAREGVGHNDLLNEWPILFVLAFNYGFEF